MDTSAYLLRIGLAEAPPADPAGLAAVQAAHRQTIPFENLSVMLGEGISCESEAAFAKLVSARRGGFCFEHNRLLADMLGAMGFDVRLLLARVLLGNPPETTPRTHCLVLVRFEDSVWIADAGFGGGYAPPMPLVDGAEAQSADGARHRLRRIGSEGTIPGAWLLERMGPLGPTDGRSASDSAWEPQFAFDLAQVAAADMAMGCHWAATHHSSRFTNLHVASICLPDGFASCVDRELSIWRAGAEPEKRVASDPQDYRALLMQHFGVALSVQEAEHLPIWREVPGR